MTENTRQPVTKSTGFSPQPKRGLKPKSNSAGKPNRSSRDKFLDDDLEPEVLCGEELAEVRRTHEPSGPEDT